MPWITTKEGKHINTDWLDEDKQKNQNELEALKKQLQEAKTFKERAPTRRKIEMLEMGWKGTEKEFIEHQKQKREAEEAQRHKEYQEKKKAKEESKKQAEEQRKKELEHELKTQPKDKVEQFRIIQKSNPMTDDYHVGIRKPSDIKDWSTAIKDNDSFSWGDFSRRDAERALREGSITIYSSYPIKQGVFVSTSKRQSQEYAGGNGKVYSKKVPLKDVAWINGDEGQFAELKKK